MALAVSTSVVNRLLDALPDRVCQSIHMQSELVDLACGDLLSAPGERIQDAYFPTNSFISLEASVNHGVSLEVALIGNDGMLGLPLMLGTETASVVARVQGAGGAWRIQAEDFKRIVRHTPVLRRELDRYTHALMAQLAQTAACTCFHLLEPRLARRLLMAHDCANADYFYLTHARLAGILGVRRSGVTTAAGELQRRGLIHYSRGGITILDREGLERAACSCYAMMHAGDRFSPDSQASLLQALGWPTKKMKA